MNDRTAHNSLPRRLIVAISGASGAILGIRLLEVLRLSEIERHLIISPAGAQTITSETGWTVRQVEALADVVYSHRDIGAAIASGSYPTQGMVIAPCSVKTLSSIAYGITDDLITRAADVNLKEGRPVVALFREAPLHVGHLRALTQFAEIGGIVFPPVPAFYARPASVDDIVTQIIGRVLDRIGVENTLVRRWQGIQKEIGRHDS
ncbi:MAG: UbiX family flavin prenyltransferase [Anaerolineae bacterium]|nr:UbiX family flavin prenyltransferase [Thermoflexales bacterium]MDW8407405.1 UbiX family flavin prenyltransferase [Anaerolineae bacterium]